MTSPAPRRVREFDRLASLHGLGPAFAAREPLFDDIARQAAALCGTPLATVTLVDEHDQRFAGSLGMEGQGGDRDEAICAYTILQDDPLVVEDASRDPRFPHFGCVIGAPFLRFHASAPIFDRSGLPLGSVRALDTVPREIGGGPILALQRLAAVTGVMLETRRVAIDLLGPRPHPVAVEQTLAHLDNVLRPLFDRANGFRATMR